MAHRRTAHLRRPLADDVGATEIQVRYNTGRHISQNGRELDRPADDARRRMARPRAHHHADRPLDGRSRRALRLPPRGTRRRDWVRSVETVVSLGSPHLGAPLARSVHYLAAALHLVPESRPFAHLLRRRSAGVRDLFHGSLVDETGPAVISTRCVSRRSRRCRSSSTPRTCSCRRRSRATPATPSAGSSATASC